MPRWPRWAIASHRARLTAKLVLVLLLSAVHGFLSGSLRRLALSPQPRKGKLGLFRLTMDDGQAYEFTRE
ncbi:hypothetical protein ACFOYU_19560 [Microvirga sp. GCM10011540]|uniref:hypothetical protein n=1 Tax=Microvirga sp. GCM10011540 TaxID=3317338 RepID=UPI00361E5792